MTSLIAGARFIFKSSATIGTVLGSNAHFCRLLHSNEPWPNP